MTAHYLRLGLTGGIASGKSTACRYFAELGAGVIDADQLARDVVAPGTEGLSEIEETFGPSVLSESGDLDRDAMRALAFADPEARMRLEAIVHPRVYMGVMDALAAFEREGRPAGMVEAALLLEKPAPFHFDAVVCVVCGADVQAKRLRESKGWPDKEIRGVLAAQLTDDERRKRADFVVENSGSLDGLRRAVEDVWRRLLDES